MFSTLQVVFLFFLTRKCSEKSTYLRADKARLGCGIVPRIRKSISFLLLFMMMFSAALLLTPFQSHAAVTQEKTTVYYFHGNMRCRTCNKIETYTKEAINKGFAKELSDGTLEIRVVNTDKSENEHFIEDFQLTNRAVVLVQSKGGELKQWKNLDRIWLLVRKKEVFQAYISDETRAFMAVDK